MSTTKSKGWKLPEGATRWETFLRHTGDGETWAMIRFYNDAGDLVYETAVG